MRLLSELASILDNYSTKDIKILGTRESNTEPDLVDTFYQLLRSENHLTEEAAAARLYGSAEKASSNSFRKLKQRLIRRMSNTLFFIDTKDRGYTNLQRAYYIAHREYALASILSGRTAGFAANYFFKRAFQRSKKYELTDILLLTTESLRRYAGLVQRDQKKFDYYDQEHENALRLYEAESVANKYFITTIVNYDVSLAGRQRTHEMTDEFVRDLDRKFTDIVPSYNYAFRYYSLDLFRWSAISDLSATLAVADRALAFFETKSYSSTVPQSYFLMYKLMVYIQQKKFTLGTEVRKTCSQYVERGLHNWFKMNELSFMLAMHTKNYDEAYTVYVETVAHPNFSKRSDNERETWLINRAYLYYLETVGKLTMPDQQDPVGKFRVMKFLNNVPEFSKEKRGMNIPILILQILYAIVRRQYDLSVERIEAIEKYCSRYVRRDEHFRSNCFIKILLQFPIAAFHKTAVERKTKNYLRKLTEQPLSLANQSYEIEVIPYEDLWELAYESLELKFHQPSVRRFSGSS